MGRESEDGCIKCKVGYYQDEPGQQGCKKCGSTAFTSEDGGATQCTCIGLGRNFVKSIGGCKCSQGFRPKNNAPNVDSDEDCEADVKPVCAPGETITVDGYCLTSAEEEFEYCNSYCAGGGSVIAGTGVCQCFDINDTDEVCDVSCQETKV